MDSFSLIVEKARELGKMIENSGITRIYYNNIQLMQNDVKSQRLLARLISLGRELDEAASGDTGGELTGKAEAELIKDELENNELVRNYILSQKDYVNLMQKVQERTKNPVNEKDD